jgi:ArsR family transcriptional regulator, arsenate/arsenite/antimonite-responsive transcriptional repressor
MKNVRSNGEGLRRALRVTKALADRQRVRLLLLLAGGERCVCQLVEALGLSTSTVSRHLSVLENAGLIEGRKEGRWAYYRCVEGGRGSSTRGVRQWLRAATDGDPQLERDRRTLARAASCDPTILRARQRRRS